LFNRPTVTGLAPLLSWSSSRAKGQPRCRISPRPARPWHPRGMEAADLSASDFSRAQLWRLGRDARDIVAAATMGNPLLVAIILPHHRPTGKHKSAALAFRRALRGYTSWAGACEDRRNTQPSSVIGRRNARRADAVSATCCAAAVTTDVLSAVRLHRPRKGRNLLAGVCVTPCADGESPIARNRSASEAHDVEYPRLLLSSA
jgi:hypothetical protein